MIAVESRKKRKDFTEGLEDRLKEKEEAYEELARRCHSLEDEYVVTVRLGIAHSQRLV